MLDTIRNAANSWIAKVFLTILLLCFALLWGIPELRQTHSNDLLTAGKSSVTVNDYRVAYGEQLVRMSLASGLGRMLSNGEAQRYQLPQFTIYQLQQNIAFDEEARRMKIGVSKDQIARSIGKNQLFMQNGVFDRNQFLAYLQQLNINENEYIQYYAQKEKRTQLLLATLGNVKMSDTFYIALSAYQNETRAIDYVTLSTQNLPPIGEPDPKTLESWFESHKQMFRAPEYRQATLMTLTPEALVKPEDISEEAAKAYYTSNLTRYQTPEKRTVEILHFASRAEADAAAQKLKNGDDFPHLVQEQGKTLASINTGSLTQDKLPSSIGTVVFSLKLKEISPVTNSLQGPVIMRLVDIAPAHTTPYKEVASAVKQTLAQQIELKQLRSTHDAIENARFEGVNLKELSATYHLPLRTITVDAQGISPQGEPVADLVQRNLLLDSVFQASEDMDLDPIAIPSGGYIWYQVDHIAPAHDRPFAQVKDKVLAQWHEEAQTKQLDEATKSILELSKNDNNLDQIIAQYRLEPKKILPPFKRDVKPDNLNASAINAIFSTGEGKVNVAQGIDKNSRIFFIVRAINHPQSASTFALSPQWKKQIDSALSEDLRVQMINFISKEAPVTIDNDNFNRIMAAP